jgi:hypothetical protein
MKPVRFNMKRNLIASVLFAWAVILAVASCDRSHSSETSNDTIKEGSSPVEIKEEATKKGPSPPAENKDPIISMVMASSIDAKGTLVNPRFSFPQTEKQITAIVQLGNIKGSQLTVTWYQTSDDGDTKLFEHQIQVKSRERAFSVAKNPGMFFSAGTYKVVATLDGQTKDVEFDIIPPKPEPKKTTDNRAERHFAGQTESRNDRAASIETNSDELFQPISYEGVSDQNWVRKVASNASPQSGAAQPTTSMAAPGQSPVSGNNGTTSPSKPNVPPEETHCGLGILTGVVDPDADAVEISITAWCNISGSNVSLDAKVDGNYRQVAVYPPSSQESTSYFWVDPCWLEGGSDLPNTKVTVEAMVGSGGVRRVITLGDDTLAPRVHVVSTPARGSKVKAGDKINLKVDATELRKGGPWQTGVKMVQVYALPGGQVGEPWVNSASPLSQKCEQKTWEHKYEATYTVPDNPPPIIQLCAEAEDYVGNPSQNCGEFVTGDWYGTLQEHEQGNIYNDTVYVDFSFSEESDGTIKGKGRVDKMTSEPQLWGGCTCTRTINLKPGEAEFPISGKRVGDEFQLEFPTDRKLTMNINCDCPPPRRSGTTEGRRSLGMSETFYRPKVKAKDDATNEFHKPGALKVDGWIGLHRAKQ